MEEVERIFEDSVKLGLPASWVRFLLRKRVAETRGKLGNTYKFIERNNIDTLTLRVFEAATLHFGVNGLEMPLDECVTLLKFAKVGEVRERDIGELIKKQSKKP